HLLLGLLRQPDCPAVRVLEQLGLTPADLRAEIERRLPPSSSRAVRAASLTPRAKRVLKLAHEEAGRMSQSYVATEHLLLGLIGEEKGFAARLLITCGADLERARSAVLAGDALDEPVTEDWQAKARRIARFQRETRRAGGL